MRFCRIVSLPYVLRYLQVILLCSVALVVHEEEIEVADIVNEESLVAGWHHVTGFLVVAVSDLENCNRQTFSLVFSSQ